MMRDVGVIFRREMGAYFHSPIAYIFIIVFLLLTSGFYTNGFFLTGDTVSYEGQPPYFKVRVWAAWRADGGV